jgi:hypothetical protein
MGNTIRSVRKFIEVLKLLKARNRRTIEVLVFQAPMTDASVNTNGEVRLPQFLRRVIGIHVERTKCVALPYCKAMKKVF